MNISSLSHRPKDALDIAMEALAKPSVCYTMRRHFDGGWVVFGYHADRETYHHVSSREAGLAIIEGGL